MKQRGFTLIEVLVAISIFTLVVSLTYGMVRSLKQIQLENKIYSQMIGIMQRDISEWRSSRLLGDDSFIVDHIVVSRTVHSSTNDEQLDRAIVIYNWVIGEKAFEIKWELEQYASLVETG